MVTGRPSVLRRLDAVAIPLPVIFRVFLGAYFLYAGINKAIDPIDFLKAVRTYGALPESPPYFLNATVIVLPWLEIVCGVGLVLGLLRRGAATTIALMLCVFTPAILVRALGMMSEQGLSFFAVEFDCGCGTGREIIWIKLIKNLGLLVLALWTILSTNRACEPGAWLARRRGHAASTRRPRRPQPDAGPGRSMEHPGRPAPVPIGTSDGT
jgi:uncharacterized membrane protein YphA (DoxX/SURF4 family)